MTDPRPQNAANRIDLSDEPEFDLGGMRVSPAELAVEQDGQRQELQPRVMQVLVALAKARPSVVSRDRLVEQCWDGRIVGDDALNRCILALRHVAQEYRPPPFAIETVPRVGHRLVVATEPKTGVAPEVGKSRRWAAIALMLLLLAAVGLFAWQQRTSAEPASIAVLPFRNVGTGDPYFAEGVGDEILGQLAREPQFRVAGSSSSSQFGKNPNVNEVAERLDVDYVLEGSVRRQGNQVRVDAGLVRASDGMRLWSDSYDGKLDDILSIQAAIGRAVADGLRRKLVHSVGGAARPIDGEAYALYLNARGLLRTRQPDLARDARLLLQRAVRLDPRYAPAWSSLAEALARDSEDQEALIAILPGARAAARRALQLDPNLAAAHGNLGILLGYGSPQGNNHLRRAAALDPRSSEGQVWLGMAHLASAEFAEERDAYERAHALDPLWHRPIRDLAYSIAEMGDRSAAQIVARRGFADDEANQLLLLMRIAKLVGDYSEMARLGSILMSSYPNSAGASSARRALADAKFLLNLSKDAPPSQGSNLDQPRFNPRTWMAAAPSATEWRNHNRSSDAALVYADENLAAAKLMLQAGRGQELVATFDGPTGLLGMKPGSSVLASQLHQAPLVALALRAVGRESEANRILSQAEALARAAYRRGKVPNWFESDAAAVWAVQGRTARALDALGRALDRGWVHGRRDDLPRLEEEPAFRSLRNHPRFTALVARLAALHARERKELAAILTSRP